ncbi:MAG: ribosome small subunit-dependent GTPase A [Lachnospiraceae bacterium]|nr:ribosome small subunit-dependent GTPase A [Lachnospiraceae bacterium]
MNNEENVFGRVIEVRKNSFIVDYNGKEAYAKLKGKFYEETEDKLPVVGDYVELVYNPSGESMITGVVNRRNILQRPDQAKTATVQYMVANVDYCFIVTSLNEDYSFNRIARYVAVALQGEVTPIVILTKSDLCTNPGRYVREVEDLSDKVKVHAVSSIYGIGLDEIEPYFESGKTICLMGSSGAGKSTLINTIAKEEIMKTNGLRESDSTGKHTTTHRQLIHLKNGVDIIDTPGMREIGVEGSGAGIKDTFEDIIGLEGKCRFRNCKHDTEPGCAIKAAIASGELDEKRFYLYKSLDKETDANNYAKMKQIAKKHKLMERESMKMKFQR